MHAELCLGSNHQHVLHLRLAGAGPKAVLLLSSSVNLLPGALDDKRGLQAFPSLQKFIPKHVKNGRAEEITRVKIQTAIERSIELLRANS